MAIWLYAGDRGCVYNAPTVIAYRLMPEWSSHVHRHSTCIKA